MYRPDGRCRRLVAFVVVADFFCKITSCNDLSFALGAKTLPDLEGPSKRKREKPRKEKRKNIAFQHHTCSSHSSVISVEGRFFTRTLPDLEAILWKDLLHQDLFTRIFFYSLQRLSSTEKSKWRKEWARGALWRFAGYDSREADARRLGHRHIFEGNAQIPAGKGTFWKIGEEGFHSFSTKTCRIF